MEYRVLGRSGLKVSALTLGAMKFGRAKNRAARSIGAKEAARQIDRAIEAGVNLIDTSDIYAGGQSEAVLGGLLSKRRQNLLLATKVRFPTGPGPNDRGLSRSHIIAACESSLRKLRTDWIDLYQVHHWDGITPLDEIMEALDSLVRAGKARYIGCSNFSAWHLMKALWTADRGGGQRFISQQIHYTLQVRDAENELVPVALDQNVGILVWSPLGGGLLTGKYSRGGKRPGDEQYLGRPWRQPPIYDEPRLFDIVDALDAVARGHGATVSQVALAWLLARPGVTSVIAGNSNLAQLEDNLAGANLKLDAEAIAQLEAASRPPLAYPYWHQAGPASDRLSPADLSLLQPHLHAIDAAKKSG